jgi:ubiquinone/menaquinone biosynthesis C-methylase UbiE
LDISQSFVEIAAKNARDAKVPVDFRQGNAAAVPFVDDAFDFICFANSWVWRRKADLAIAGWRTVPSASRPDL